MKRTRVLIALLALLAACASPVSRLPPPPSQKFRFGEDAMARQEYEAAASAYRQYLSNRPDESYVPRAYYQLALAEHRRQRDTEALTILQELEDRYPDRDWVQVHALRGDVELALGRRTAALLDWDRAWPIAAEHERAVLANRIEVATKDISEEEREQLRAVITTPEVCELIGLTELPPLQQIPSEPRASVPAEEAQPGPESPPAQLADSDTLMKSRSEEPPPIVAIESRDAEPDATVWELVEPLTSDGAAAIAAVEPPVDTGSSTLTDAQAVAAVPERTLTGPAPSPQPVPKVACLLPLTGPNRANGERALAGLRLAFADSPEQLAVRDTGGVPESATDLLTTLDEDPAVLAVIGPLSSGEAEVAAPLAERAGLPLLLLSQRDGLAGRFVLQPAVTSKQFVDALAGYAVDMLELQRFGIIYPENNYGESLAKLFMGAVATRGATVVGSARYQPGSPNLVAISAAVRGWRRSGLQAVLIPDSAGVAAGVAAQAREALPDVALLGTDSWNDPEALAKAGPCINGAIFPDSFFAGSEHPSTREFVERVQRQAGHLPSAAEAQSFDAAMAIRSAMAAGADSRDRIIPTLAAMETLGGTGELHPTPNGLRRSVTILRYRDGTVELIGPRGGDG